MLIPGCATVASMSCPLPVCCPPKATPCLQKRHYTVREMPLVPCQISPVIIPCLPLKENVMCLVLSAPDAVDSPPLGSLSFPPSHSFQLVSLLDRPQRVHHHGAPVQVPVEPDGRVDAVEHVARPGRATEEVLDLRLVLRQAAELVHVAAHPLMLLLLGV